MAERYSQHGCIKRGLRAWGMSQGMHRIGLVDTDGDGLLDDRLAVQLNTELYQHVLSSSDMWMRAVYLIVNEGLSLPGAPAQWAGEAPDGAEHVGLSQLPSLFGLELSVCSPFPLKCMSSCNALKCGDASSCREVKHEYLSAIAGPAAPDAKHGDRHTQPGVGNGVAPCARYRMAAPRLCASRRNVASVCLVYSGTWHRHSGAARCTPGIG